ncbi:ParA family protein [Microlunatus endophyticus]|nr:ParA family protein [Microlunatus endophyticus]
MALQRAVAIGNGKGGCGKSSTAAAVAGLSAAADYEVVLVDLDPQGDLADELGVRDHPDNDGGDGLLRAVTAGVPLPKPIQARPNLYLVPGGPALYDLSGVLLSRQSRGQSVSDALTNALQPIADNAELCIIDTPPGDVLLQNLALTAARWLIIPTTVDTSSIRALHNIADRVGEARRDNGDLEVLGVVLWNIPVAAKRIRREARATIDQVLGKGTTMFTTTIRSAPAAAYEVRVQGKLVHELAEAVEGAEPFWKALREGREVRTPGTAPALAAEYIQLTDEILTRMAAAEADAGAGAPPMEAMVP